VKALRRRCFADDHVFVYQCQLVLLELANFLLRLFLVARRRSSSQIFAINRSVHKNWPLSPLLLKPALLIQLGVEREMKICHHQPHLVPPMKLVFYDDMPATPQPPPPSQLSQLVAQGRNLASRASGRASLSVRKKPSSRPSISGPIPIQSADDLPFRRRNQYRPLELSIYLPDNRLSDLPDFNVADFDDLGEIRLPAKALTRSKSEERLRHSPSPSLSKNLTTSMVGERQLDYWQNGRSSSVISTSRPPSAHDTFHSHPVVWNSLPGIPAGPHQRPVDPLTGVTVLSPMQEEFTPVEAPSVDHMIEFPQVDEEPRAEAVPSPAEPVSSEIQRPFKLSQPPTPQSYRARPRSRSRTNSLSRNRISQWLSRSASTATSGSHASHTKKSQFYQCAATPPRPSHSHSRTLSTSTVATSILSGAPSPCSLTTITTTTTTTVQDLRSRSNTFKSLEKRTVIVETELPPYLGDGRDSVPEAAPLKAPVIGMAF
jgi:hypothetical protein